MDKKKSKKENYKLLNNNNSKNTDSSLGKQCHQQQNLKYLQYFKL